MTHAIGGIGTLMVLAMYGAVTAGWLTADSVLYLGGNLVGAAILTWYTWRCRTYASVFYNFVWIVISAAMLWR